MSIKRKIIYVNKEFVKAFEEAVAERKWLFATSITSTDFNEHMAAVLIKVMEMERVKEKKYVIKYIFSYILAKECVVWCSTHNVYFKITKNFMEGYS